MDKGHTLCLAKIKFHEYQFHSTETAKADSAARLIKEKKTKLINLKDEHIKRRP